MTPKVGSMGKPSPLYDVDIVDKDGKLMRTPEGHAIVVRPGYPKEFLEELVKATGDRYKVF